MAAELRSGILPESEWPQWDRLTGEALGGSIYSTTAYLDALCAATGARFRVLGVWRGDDLAGGVALFERQSAAAGTWVGPRLLLYYNGPILRRYDTRYPSERTARHLKILAALEASLRGMGYGRLTLKARAEMSDVRAFVERGWSASPTYTYVVSLSDLPAQWNRVEQNLRRLIERCGKQQQAVVTEDDDFDAFFRLHEMTMTKYGVEPYLPRASFQQWDPLESTCRHASLSIL